MSLRALRASALAVVATLSLAGASQAQDAPHSTLTITLAGTAGPILSGSDIANVNDESATATLLLNEAMSPYKQTSTTAMYKIPAGAVTLVVGGSTYRNESPGRMAIRLANGADVLTLTYVFEYEGVLPVTVVETSFLAKDSWTSAVLTHPGVFTPSPQRLRPAATATTAGSKLQYTVEGETTVLGIKGTATSTSKADPVLPDDDDSE